MQQIQENRLWLQWTLLFAERFAIPDKAKRALALLARKAKIYACINELVADPTTRSSDNTIAGLSFGSLIEWQVGSLELARQHLGFLWHTLLPQRVGLQTMSVFGGFSTYLSLIGVGLGIHAFANMQMLSAAVERFLSIISAMQKQVLKARQQQSADGQMRESSGSFQHYMLSRKRAFAASSVLHSVLTSEHPINSVLSCHQLVLLWVINKMLFELRSDVEMASEFLDTMHRYVESYDNPSAFSPSISPNNARKAGSGLKVFAVNAVVGHISTSFIPKVDSRAVDWTSEMKPSRNRCLLRFWENVDMGE